MGLINIETTEVLSSNAIDISHLDPISECEKYDVFIASRKTTAGLDTFKSIRFNYDILSSTIMSNLISSDITFTGNWSFKKDIKIPTKNIKREAENGLDINSTVAINVDFMNISCLQNVYNLSAEIYNKVHMPSYVGQIITSDVLSSIEKVKEVYGNNTEWKQLSNVFIMGCGRRDANTIETTNIITGNEPLSAEQRGGHLSGLVTLKKEDIPVHNHGKIDADPQNFSLTYLFGQDYDAQSKEERHQLPIAKKASKLVVVKVHGNDPKRLILGTKYHLETGTVEINGKTYSTVPDDSVMGISAAPLLPTMTFSGKREFSSKDYCTDGHAKTPSILSVIYDTSYEKIKKQIPFNHMPLFYAAYIWKRIR